MNCDTYEIEKNLLSDLASSRTRFKVAIAATLVQMKRPPPIVANTACITDLHTVSLDNLYQ